MNVPLLPHATTAEPPETDGPVAQSIGIGFAVLQLATVVLALFWAASNIRQVPPDTQAVVLRFGRVVAVQPAGLVLAWPRPFELVELLPSTQRQLNLKIDAAQPPSPAIVDPASRAMGELPPPGAGLFLTGDGGAVLMDASVTYHIADAKTYYVTQAHIEPALRRLFLASAVTVSAGRSIDDFMVVHSEQTSALQSQREALRGALVAEMNRRLADLQQRGAGLGIAVMRADLTVFLPPAAKFAFDSVLDATQMAQQGLAAARTDAALIGQNADHERDRILAEAHANASERVSSARAHVAPILAIDPAQRPGLVDQLYRERIANIIKQAGGVSTMDLSGGSRVVLSGGQP